MDIRFLLLGSVVALFIIGSNADGDLLSLIKTVNENLAELYDEETEAKWQNEISLSKDRERIEIARNKITQFLHGISADVANYKKQSLENKHSQILLSLIPVGYEALSEEEFKQIVDLSNNITNIYKSIKLCSFRDQSKCDLTFVPVVQNIAFRSNDPEEVKFYWLEWRRKAGAVVKDNFKKFIELYRKSADMNGFSKPSDFWLKGFGESGSAVKDDLENAVLQLRPMFQQAHAHLRGNMRLKYGSEIIEYNKPIPQHLYLPFMQKAFISGSHVVLPFATTNLPNIAEILLQKERSAHDNFLAAVSFLESLGMPHLEESYWQHHAVVIPDSKAFDQTHKAWKFYLSNDVKLSYSSLIKESTFFNMYEAVSDIYYNRAYKNIIPLLQRDPATKLNEALGKFFSLAAASPKYLEKLDITYPSYETREARVNRLYAKGLRSIFSTPIHYALESYRLRALDQDIDVDDNCAYWELSESLYGVQPPVSRSKDDFDASGVLRIKLDEEHTSFIYTTILQYQLFEHFCSLTGEYVKDDPEKPLDLCDLSGHHIVGEKIHQVMSLGTIVSLKEFLKVLMDSEELNISGLLEYYKPLVEWLVEENKAKNNEVGWEKSNRCLA